MPRSSTDTIYVGLNDRDKAWHDLYEVKISTGERKLLRKNTDRITGWEFDNKDQLRWRPDRRTTATPRSSAWMPPVSRRSIPATCSRQCAPARFDKNNKLLYFTTNKGADVDLVSLTLLDPETGKTQVVESDPNKRVDFGGPIFSDLSNELVGTIYIDDKVRSEWKNKEWAADFHWAEKQLPGKELRPGSFTKDEKLWLVNGCLRYGARGNVPLQSRHEEAHPAIQDPGEVGSRRVSRPWSRCATSHRTAWKFRRYLTLPGACRRRTYR